MGRIWFVEVGTVVILKRGSSLRYKVAKNICEKSPADKGSRESILRGYMMRYRKK